MSVAPAIGFPRESSIAIRTGGEMATSTSIVSGGCVVKASTPPGSDAAGDQLGCASDVVPVVSRACPEPSVFIT